MPKKSTKSDTNGTPSDKKTKKKSEKSEEKRDEKERSRNWATVIYPDSKNTPENFREIIADSHVACFLSPLHDQDVDEATGLKKKPHYHLIAKYETVKYQEQFQEFTKTFGGVGAERIHDWRSYSRYLCHLDHPHKARYQEKDVISFNGLNYEETVKSLSEIEEELDRIVFEIITFCDEHQEEIGNSFARLLRYSMKERPDWFRHLRKDCAYIIEKYLKSASWDEQNSRRKRLEDGRTVNLNTGEIEPSSSEPDRRKKK